MIITYKKNAPNKEGDNPILYQDVKDRLNIFINKFKLDTEKNFFL